MDRVCRVKNRTCSNEIDFLFSLFLVLNADQCKRVSVEYKFFSAAFMDLELRNGAKFLIEQ